MPPPLFGKFTITNQIFYQTRLTLGVVNLKPLVPGHVLMIPRRVEARYGDLTTNEVHDLFESVQIVGKVLEKEFKAGSLTIAIQDGALAGQSVPHCHVHIMPRKPNDFVPADEVYTALDSSNIAQDYERRKKRADRIKMDADEDRIARSSEVMKAEAIRLTALFPLENQGEFTD